MKKIGVGLVMMMFGCGGGSSGVSLDQFPQQSATTICKQNFTCCDPSELAGKTMADCVNNNQLLTGVLSGSISDAQAKGRASYNAAQMGTCLKEIAGLSCDEWKMGKDPTNRASCTAAITAKVAVGGACQQSFECTSGNCVGATTDDNGNPVDGTCMAAPTAIAVGAACTGVGDTCVQDAYCDSTSQTCKAKKAAGETCASSDECANTCDSATSKCTCYVGCGVAAPATRPGSLLSLAVLGLAIAGVRLRRRKRR